MRREDDVFCADLLLSPGKHRFQIYRNGKLASEKVHSLRCVLNVRKVMPFDMQSHTHPHIHIHKQSRVNIRELSAVCTKRTHTSCHRVLSPDTCACHLL